MDYQWYPGHMTKARRMMEENIGLVDLVIELTDARIPMSSRNPDIDKLCANKARILVMTKADLADPARTAAFQQYFEDKGWMVIPVDARTKKANEKVRAYVEKACAAKRERDKRRGIIGRPLRAMMLDGTTRSRMRTGDILMSVQLRASTVSGTPPPALG